MAKKLIITADDYGLSESGNRDIIECYRRGIVTDISLLAMGGAFGHAVKLAKENGINKMGVHLAVSENYKQFFLKYFTGSVSTDEIYKKFKNQISRVKKENFAVTHLDSHQHVHAVPGIFKIVLRLMEEENISYMRFPLERLGIRAELGDPLGWVRNILLSSMCRLCKPLLERSGAKYADYFIGHARAFRLRRKDLISAISGLKEGLTELGCHPGEREEELKVLCDKSFLEKIKKQSIKLVSY